MGLSCTALRSFKGTPSWSCLDTLRSGLSSQAWRSSSHTCNHCPSIPGARWCLRWMLHICICTRRTLRPALLGCTTNAPELMRCTTSSAEGGGVYSGASGAGTSSITTFWPDWRMARPLKSIVRGKRRGKHGLEPTGWSGSGGVTLTTALSARTFIPLLRVT